MFQLPPGATIELDPTKIRDIRSEVLDASGRIQVLPASYWATTTMPERALFGLYTGIYGYPTVELVARLKEIIAGRPAIEVGAGHGVLAEALGIPATDSFQQRVPRYALALAQMKQKPVPYGPNVIEMHASRAVRHFKPDVVIGCWVTHKWDPKYPEREGNEVGLDEPDILRHCAAYVLVGNEHVHRHKHIWDRKHEIEFPPYVFSRSASATRDFIAIFPGLKRN